MDVAEPMAADELDEATLIASGSAASCLSSGGSAASTSTFSYTAPDECEPAAAVAGELVVRPHMRMWSRARTTADMAESDRAGHACAERAPPLEWKSAGHSWLDYSSTSSEAGSPKERPPHIVADSPERPPRTPAYSPMSPPAYSPMSPPYSPGSPAPPAYSSGSPPGSPPAERSIDNTVDELLASMPLAPPEAATCAFDDIAAPRAERDAADADDLTRTDDDVMQPRRPCELQCLICLEFVNAVKLVACGAPDVDPDAEQHMICNGCLAFMIDTWCKLDGRNEALRRCRGVLMCQAPGCKGQIPDQQIALHTEPAVFECYIANRVRVQSALMSESKTLMLEGELRARVSAELDAVDRDGRLAREVKAIKDDVLDNVLVTRCPNELCRQAFDGFGGCFALHCDGLVPNVGRVGCGKYFCAW